MKDRKLILSVTAKDCIFKGAKGSGKGGQSRNKSNNAYHCTHKESGAQGYAGDTRSGTKNKALAFKRMSHTQEFNQWHVGRIAELMNVCPANELKVEIGK